MTAAQKLLPVARCAAVLIFTMSNSGMSKQTDLVLAARFAPEA